MRHASNEVATMQELTGAECRELAGLIVRVGRPTNQADKDLMERWATRLSLRSHSWVLPHDTDLLA